MKFSLRLFFAFLVFNLSNANLGITQETEKEEFIDVIYLKNGSKFVGQLLSYDSVLKIKLLSGNEIDIPKSEISRVTQKTKFKKERVKRPYQFQETGIYHSFTLGLLPESSGTNKDIGTSLHTSLGYQMNRWFGLGVGFGVDNYFPGGWERIYPVYLESRGYFAKKNTTMYYNLNAGYGFTFKNKSLNVTDGLGGFYFSPNLGTRFGARDNANLFLEVGLKFQRSRFRIDRWGELINQKVLYQRFSIKMGLLL